MHPSVHLAEKLWMLTVYEVNYKLHPSTCHSVLCSGTWWQFWGETLHSSRWKIHYAFSQRRTQSLFGHDNLDRLCESCQQLSPITMNCRSAQIVILTKINYVNFILNGCKAVILHVCTNTKVQAFFECEIDDFEVDVQTRFRLI